MRIAYLTQPYPPMISGASIMAEHLAEEMAGRGHEVLVVCASDRGHAYTRIKDNLTIARLKSISNPLRVGQRFMPDSRRAVLDLLSGFQPDLIHVHEPLRMGPPALDHGKRTRVPVILTTHQLPWFISQYLPDKFHIREIAEELLWQYSTRLIKRFSSVITPTNTISKIIRKKTGVRTKTISYGVDPEVFRPCIGMKEKNQACARYGLPADAPVILHVGRLDADKSVHAALLAAAHAMQNNDAHLLIVGDGKQKGHLIELCRSLGINSRVRFPGFIVDKDELAQVYRMSDVFITASEIETQGIVLLEAAASGLPIVAVDATCIPEIVHDGVNGFLAEPRDIESFGSSITALLQNPRLAKEMGLASRKIAACHNIHESMDAHQELYMRLVRQNQPVATRNESILHDRQPG